MFAEIRWKSQNPFCQAEELVKKGKTLEDIKKLIKLQRQGAQSDSSPTNVIDDEIEDEMLDERYVFVICLVMVWLADNFKADNIFTL